MFEFRIVLGVTVWVGRDLLSSFTFFDIVFEFDLIIEIAGVGSVEDGDGAAAFFFGRFGFVEGIDEGAESIEAGVGEFGGATRRTYGLQGREVVIAARLMEQAGPGEVVVSDRIASAVGSRTRLEPLGAITVKGAAQPVELFRLPIA